jgi:hypothetical protein
MTCPSMLYGRAWLRVFAAGLLLTIGTACAGDRVGPTPETTGAADSTLAPADSAVVLAPADSLPVQPVDSAAQQLAISSLLQGVVFGVSEMPKTLLTTVYNGTAPGGALDPSNMLSLLSLARSKGARIVVKLCMGRDMFVKNADGTFSFTKWKALVDRYKVVNFSSYISDGTILGHYLIDEPSRAERWGGKIISPATLEAMAAYSKKIWPGMPTLVRVVPSWLASFSQTYTYLDAGWLQYASRMGNPTTMVTNEIAAAKRKGLGLVVGMNVLDGGNGSSGLRGYSTGKWKMSATEVRNYGTALLNQTYVCGFFTWMWDATYYGRSDVKSAMSALSSKARAHARTSCRQ